MVLIHLELSPFQGTTTDDLESNRGCGRKRSQERIRVAFPTRLNVRDRLVYPNPSTGVTSQ